MLMQMDLWICLICGHVGCGRYREGHAIDHWKGSHHCYALELETQRVRNGAGCIWGQQGQVGRRSSCGYNIDHWKGSHHCYALKLQVQKKVKEQKRHGLFLQNLDCTFHRNGLYKVRFPMS